MGGIEHITVENLVKVNPDGSVDYGDFTQGFQPVPDNLLDTIDGGVIPSNVLNYVEGLSTELAEPVSIQITDVYDDSGAYPIVRQEFMLLDNDGNPLTLDIANNPFNLITNDNYGSGDIAFLNSGGESEQPQNKDGGPLILNPVHNNISPNPGSSFVKDTIDLKQVYIRNLTDMTLDDGEALSIHSDVSYNQVLELQASLLRLGYEHPNIDVNLSLSYGDMLLPENVPHVTGVYENTTEQAVMNIQEALGLEVTGVVDQDFLDSINQSYIELQKLEQTGNVQFSYPDGTSEERIIGPDNNSYSIPSSGFAFDN